MTNINRVVLTGNLTRDPELRSLPSGTSVGDLRIANNERYKDSNGEWTDRANYFSITVWGAQAENCARFLAKGRKIAVDGTLRYEEWENDQGAKRSAVKIVARSVEFLDAPPNSRDSYPQGEGYPGCGPQPERHAAPVRHPRRPGRVQVRRARPERPGGRGRHPVLMSVNISCANCGVVFCLPDGMYHSRKRDGDTFYCPNGHGQSYRPTEDEKKIAELERRLAGRDRMIERWQEQWNEIWASREELIGAMKECPGQCGWRSRKQIPRDAVGMGRGIERVKRDVAEHLVREHGAQAQPIKLLPART